ncbi:Hpt domain-containing protein [Pedobacter mucosus]|uniref:Hpt domain-containing protein n=1 Tax=Pedobacter mucosus TaxID=2895286 RepID=UPI001EE4DBA4|nr:Hpt domain-containing protein [Pedobacter mucosus]UKT66102.1 Hpt domain-containing protein [Pedobacter mucosus]
MQKTQPLNLSYLKEMVGEDPLFMIEVFDTFLEQTPFYLAELEDALANQNWIKVGNCAHKMKPTFSYIGRNDVKDFMQNLENKARNQVNIETIANDVEKLKELLAQIYNQLETAKTEMKSLL